MTFYNICRLRNCYHAALDLVYWQGNLFANTLRSPIFIGSDLALHYPGRRRKKPALDPYCVHDRDVAIWTVKGEGSI